MIPAGRPFFKMSGSGNDFVFIDARETPPGPLGSSEAVKAICARGTGVGADGVVFLLRPEKGTIRMRYLNSDGSIAALCGNATLCTARLVSEMGAANGSELEIETESGIVPARFVGGRPEIDLSPPEQVTERFAAPLKAGELRIGFVVVGVPHLVVLCEDVERADVVGRGRKLRHHPELGHGANVNFVSRSRGGGWRIRTYERGVESETLACGTGAVAAGVVLAAWAEGGAEVALETRSGLTLRVRLRTLEGALRPSLSGEARLVFTGALGELPLGRGEAI